MRDGCAAAARRRRNGSATDARWTDDRSASVALLSRIRRASVVCPSRARRPSVIRPKSASSTRLCIVGVSSQCGQVVVLVAVAVVASSSHASSRRRRTVVAPSSHRCRIVVATSSCCHLPAVKTPPLILETIPHMSSELIDKFYSKDPPKRLSKSRKLGRKRPRSCLPRSASSCHFWCCKGAAKATMAL